MGWLRRVVTAPAAGWKRLPGPAKTMIVSGAAAFASGYVPGFAAVVNDGSLPTYPAIPWAAANSAGIQAGVRGVIGMLAMSPDGIVPAVAGGGAMVAHLMQSPIRAKEK